jgi:hypothetical protein
MCSINLVPSHEDVCGIGGIALTFLISALDGGEWSGARHDCLTLGEEALGTHFIGGWLSPESVWTLWKGEKSIASAGNRTLAIQPVACRHTD